MWLRRCGIVLGASALLAAQVPAHAQLYNPDFIKGISGSDIVAVLETFGIMPGNRVETVQAGTYPYVTALAPNGVHFATYFVHCRDQRIASNCASLLHRACFDESQVPRARFPSLTALNTFNSEVRPGRAYLTRDGASFCLDHLLRVEGTMRGELRNMYLMWFDMVQDFRRQFGI